MYQGRSQQPLWTPPPNFSQVETGIYRSAYPTLASVPFLHHIGIKTIVLLSIEFLPVPVVRAISEGDVVAGTTSVSDDVHAWKDNECIKWPIRIVSTADLSEWMNEYVCAKDDFAVSSVQRALDFALQPDFQPVLFTCPTGELQTSVIVGCMRRHQGWSLAAVLAECELFVNVTGGVRQSVMNFIEQWDPDEHPVREEDIAKRKRELLLRDPSLSYSVKRHRRTVTHSASDPDSEYDDPLAMGTSRLGQKGTTGNSAGMGLSLSPYKNSGFDKSTLSSTRVGGDELGLSHSSHVVIKLASWYTAAMKRRAAAAEAIVAARAKVRAPSDPLPEPHERYFGVLNPPALDERSTFTKKSIVQDLD